MESIINGEVLEPYQVESMVYTQLKKKVPSLIEALNGRVDEHHRMMISYHLNHLNFVQTQINEIEQKIEESMTPYQKEVDLLDTIPGIDKNAAASILAETGIDMFSYKKQ